MAPPRRVEVAVVGRAIGLRGEVRVVPHRIDTEALAAGVSVVAVRGADSEELRVEKVARAGRALRVKFIGVDDRDRARALTGSALEVERSLLPPPPEGEAYLVDLVGARVRCGDLDLGEVEEIVAHPSVDALRIRRPDGTVVEQPWCPPWIGSWDVAEGWVELSSDEGLFS